MKRAAVGVGMVGVADQGTACTTAVVQGSARGGGGARYAGMQCRQCCTGAGEQQKWWQAGGEGGCNQLG